MKTTKMNSELKKNKTEISKNNNSQTLKNNIQKNISVDLTKKYQGNEGLTSEIKGFKKGLLSSHKDFEVGQIITFYGGYNNDILYTAEIIGFDKEEGIYLYWDCYWFPIKNNADRKIVKR